MSKKNNTNNSAAVSNENSEINTITQSTNKIFKFYEKRWIYFIISSSIMIIGIIAMFINGVHLDINFRGGALLKYSFTGNLTSADAETAGDIVSGVLDRPVSAQVTENLANGEKRLIINISGNNGMAASVQKQLDSSLKEKFPDAGLKLSEASMVEPYYGKMFFRNGMIAIALSFTLVMVYVWIRFKTIGGLSAGAMAIVALIHDVLVVFFTCVIFKISIGDSFVAVALSIIGYSVNDTIVIYDRIRENRRNYRDLPVDQLTNLSITQCMHRSMNTNFAVLLSVTMVYVLAFSHGIDSIQSFALPMAVGSISGCYSTICIAGPLWVMWKMRKQKSNMKVA